MLDFGGCLIIVEDIMETFPLEHIEIIFDLFADYLKNKSLKMITEKKLMILKITNSVLKRLSTCLNTKLRGKIQLLLNELFSIADKSGVNLKGKYNVNNFQMNFGLNSSKKENETEEDVDDLFYQQFWILQKYLMNPFLVSLFNYN